MYNNILMIGKVTCALSRNHVCFGRIPLVQGSRVFRDGATAGQHTPTTLSPPPSHHYCLNGEVYRGYL
jgi:hypothetical protein